MYNKIIFSLIACSKSCFTSISSVAMYQAT
jgi:hypothetical protein